ncbi:zinc ribbon domain-containing protein, partial [Candidatus Poseidoniales archaeon]|nr:zinc ribbon domain-containing protein [Candidatus Poseidoniales archaeon]
MQCGSCAEEIPNDSIFCPECGARQEVSRAGSFANTGSVGLGGQEVTGGRNFGVVSGEAVRQQRDMGQGQTGGLPPEVLQQIAMGVQQQQNIPQGQFPPQQGMPPNQMGQFPPQGLPPQQGMPPNQMGQFPPQNQQPTNVVGGARSDLPQQLRGPSLSSGAVPQKNPANVTAFNPGGTMVA